jgi:hypothetical protein
MYDLESTRALVREAAPEYRPTDKWPLSVAKILSIIEEYR